MELGLRTERKSGNFSIDVFSMTYLDNQNHQPLFLDFVNNAVIAGADFMKRIIPFHLGYLGGRRIGCKIFDALFYGDKVFFGKLFETLENGRAKFKTSSIKLTPLSWMRIAGQSNFL